MLSGEVADLAGLLAYEVVGVVDVLVNELSVLDIDKRGEEEDGVEDESKTPKWEPLDEPVGEEGRDEALVAWLA